MECLSENKKAHFDYEIIEKIEAGISLTGQEVKSIKEGHMGLKGSYVVIDKNGEAFLIGANVPPYQPKNISQDYRSDRSRKLLLKRKEIDYLIGKSREKNLTLVPLKVYTKNGKIKLEFGLGKGKKEFNKKETIKRREADIEIRREFRG
jgi:SsrA-binding protein